MDSRHRMDHLLEQSLPPGEPADLNVSVMLLNRARGGDAHALNELMSRYQGRLLRVVRVQLSARLRRFVESMDIVQETFRAALPKVDAVDVDNHADLLNWLSRIAVNQIHAQYDHHFAQKRQRGREVELENDDIGAMHGPTLSGQSPDDHAFHREVRDILDAAVSALPEDARKIVLMRDYFGASWDNIAAAMGKSGTHAARQVHHRAWIKVRQAVWPKLGGLKE